MRKILLVSAAMLGAAIAAPAFAQTSPDTSAAPPPTTAAPAAPVTRHVPAHHVRRPATAGLTENGARPGHEPGVGVSEPSSDRASNINAADSHSQIAPTLPTPANGANADPRAYLRDAQDALRQNRTGAAQEALERAETGLLNNPANPADPTGGPVGNQLQQTVGQARQALGRGDRTQARQLVDQALAQTARGQDAMTSPPGNPGM